MFDPGRMPLGGDGVWSAMNSLDLFGWALNACMPRYTCSCCQQNDAKHVDQRSGYQLDRSAGGVGLCGHVQLASFGDSLAASGV